MAPALVARAGVISCAATMDQLERIIRGFYPYAESLGVIGELPAEGREPAAILDELRWLNLMQTSLRTLDGLTQAPLPELRSVHCPFQRQRCDHAMSRSKSSDKCSDDRTSGVSWTRK